MLPTYLPLSSIHMPNRRIISSNSLALLLGAWIYCLSFITALSYRGTYTSPLPSWIRSKYNIAFHPNTIHPHHSSHQLFALPTNNIEPKIHIKHSAISTPTRYSSRDAASLLEHSSIDDNLLLITCDGSGRGGGSKHEGLAAVLRILHGVNKLPHLHNATDASIRPHDKVDLIDTIYKRRAPSRKYSNEVAAISLGIKRALEVVPISCRNRVLILSDSESALRFYCGDHSTSSNNHHHHGQSHRRLLQRLIDESSNGVIFTKIRSSSRGIGMMNSEKIGEDGNDTCTKSWDGIGFIDHDAADYLSSATRSIPNSKLDLNVEELEQLPFRVVCQLRPQDIEWLENSDDGVKTLPKPVRKGNVKYWNKITVRGSDAREEQRRRNESKVEMIRIMLGIEGL